MKKITLLAIVLMAIVSTGAFAQQNKMGRRTSEQRTEIVLKNMTEKLVLTADQQTGIQELILKREKLREAGTLSKTHRDEINKGINAILTKEQQSQYAEMRKDTRAKEEQRQQRRSQ